ncbi:unnamed protein product [Amoebophrya sp. A25]|nr:unnamed protein product [Amoebophrya sp. A25]|eukprot:GSA25T00026975001.1
MATAEEEARASPQYIDLAKRPDLIDSWQLRYFPAGKGCRHKAEKTRDIQNGSGNKRLFENELMHGDHHQDSFYQGEKKASKIFMVTGTYGLCHRSHARDAGGIRGFVGFGRRAHFIETRNVDQWSRRPEGYDKNVNGYVMRWRFLICGSDVDVDDALRFTCSLLYSRSGVGTVTGSCI